MPRHEPDPTKVSATIPIYDKGDYEFIVGAPKPFERTNQNTGKTSHGVRYGLRCAEVIEGDDNMKGKTSVFTCYQHSEGAIQFSKSFQMACLGFDRTWEGEQAFNAASVDMDWGYDPDDGDTGDAWKSLEGKRVLISLDVGVNPESGDPNQDFTAFRPV